MAYPKGAPKPKGSGIKKGQKQFKTLLKEERRKIFDAEVSKVFLAKIKVAKPEYVIDQFMGKAPDEIRHTVEVTKVVRLNI